MKIILGLFVSSVCIYFTTKNVMFDKMEESLDDINYPFIILAILSIAFIHVFRSIRWRVILSPVQKIKFKELFPLDNVGYMSNVILPLRIGDLLRPYLVSSSKKLPYGSILATTLIEKFFDLITILTIMTFILFTSTLPTEIMSIGYILIGIFALSLVIIYFLHYQKETFFYFINYLMQPLSSKKKDKIVHSLNSLVDGLKIVSSPKKLLSIFFLSLFLWGLSSLGIYNLFLSLNYNLPFHSAFLVMIMLMLAVSIPSAPLQLGTIQLAFHFILFNLYGVDENNALLPSYIYHAIFLGIAVLYGVTSLFFIDFSIKELKDKAYQLMSKK